MCCKGKKWWVKQLIHYDKSITREESNIIINTFIFTSKSKDLIDNPLINFGTKLVLVPSLTYQMCPEIALVSMLTHHGMQLNFKGYAFEKRVKKKLEEAGIVARQISAHTNISNKKINRESDVIFLINNTLFILECKSIVPPYTIRDHAKTNSKIFKELEKFKVNAAYFEKNLEKVLQKLDKEPNFFIKEVIKVFVTSSTLGRAEKVDDIYLIDEAAFNSFILRKAPLIRDTSMNVYFQQNNWEFKGEITAKKLKSFLSNPPSIKGMERLLVREVHTIDNLQILRYRKK